MKNDSARALAFESLKKCIKNGKYSNLEVIASLSRSTLDTRDKALYTALVYGVIEKTVTLDFIIAKYSRVPLDKLDDNVITAIRLGLYQIIYMDRVPDFSACDESVKLVPRQSKPYVNAVIRAVLKDKDKIDATVSEAPLSVRYSVPNEIIDLWIRGYGREKTEEILQGFMIKPDMTVRVNQMRITPSELAEKLGGKIHSLHGDMVVASGSAEALWGFDDGMFFVQGTNSRYAVKALGLVEGETVVDTCACPGGKSFSAALDMNNRGRVYSLDLHANKLSLIDKGAKRLGIDIIETAVHNGSSPRQDLVGKADAVICDVPCSGLGIIAKKPDIKYKSIKDIEGLPNVQSRILEASAEYLKPGGRLMYSTCTLNPDENERITEAFLKSHKDFHRAEGFPRTAFPSDVSDDGFFCDLIIKD